MRGSSLCLALLGFGVVQAVPTRTEVQRRTPQIWGIGDPSTSLTPGDNPRQDCDPRIIGFCVPAGITGGLKPPKRETIHDFDSDRKAAIAKLEVRLEKLQNKKHKTEDDLEEIDEIYDTLNYLVGITDIYAPPGTTSTFTSGKVKRELRLPADAAAHPKEVMADLEVRLQRLQNKEHKSEEDREEIEGLRAALRYLAGITVSKAPPGSTSTFTWGKRSFTLPGTAASHPKEAITELEIRLKRLQNKEHKSAEDREEIEGLRAALRYLADITKITAPPGTTSTFTIGKRQSLGPVLGEAACALVNIPALKEWLEEMYDRYGAPEDAPKQVFQWEQDVVTILQACGQTVPGWTTLTPGTPVPGGTINPDRPGGGGTVHPSD